MPQPVERNERQAGPQAQRVASSSRPRAFGLASNKQVRRRCVWVLPSRDSTPVAFRTCPHCRALVQNLKTQLVIPAQAGIQLWLGETGLLRNERLDPGLRRDDDSEARASKANSKMDDQRDALLKSASCFAGMTNKHWRSIGTRSGSLPFLAMIPSSLLSSRAQRGICCCSPRRGFGQRPTAARPPSLPSIRPHLPGTRDLSSPTPSAPPQTFATLDVGVDVDSSGTSCGQGRGR